MSDRIKIELVANGTIWCFPSDVGPIRQYNEFVTVIIKGKPYGLKNETAEELIARLDKAK